MPSLHALQEFWSHLQAPFQLSNPIALLLLVLIVPTLLLWGRLTRSLPHPDITMHEKIRTVSWPRRFCQALIVAVIALWSIALSHPMTPRAVEQISVDSRAFMLCFDHSGSMNSQVKDKEARQLVADQLDQWNNEQIEKRKRFPKLYERRPFVKEVVAPEGPTRFQLARYFSGIFLDGRPYGDRCGAILFNDQADVKWIPTLNVPFVKKLLYSEKFEFGGGTNFDGPKKPGEPDGVIQVCIDTFNLIDDDGVELCPEKTRIFVLISDGEAGISEGQNGTVNRFAPLVEAMKKDPTKRIRIYAFVIGEKAQMENDYTKQLRRFCEAVNGPGYPDAVVLATHGPGVAKAFRHLSATEKSTVKTETRITHHDVSRPFVQAGSGLFVLFLIAGWRFRENI
jgi:hypothetical protein